MPFRAQIKPTINRNFGYLLALSLALGFVGRSAQAEPAFTELGAVRALCTGGKLAERARAQEKVGSARVRAAQVLPNPSLLVEHQRSLRGDAERETVVGLSVPLSLSGRHWLLRDAAHARHQQVAAEARAALFEGALDFRAAYATAVVERARVEIMNEQQVMLDASSAIVEALQSRGDAATYDLLRQRLQARVHRGLLEAAQARAAGSRTQLQAWTGKEVVLPSVDLVAFAQGEPEVAIAAASKTHEVQALRAASQASLLEARAARRRWVPDPEVFAGYRALDTGAEVAHGVSAAITLPLTFFDHGQGEAALADAQRSLTDAAIDEVQAQQSAAERAARIRWTQLLHGFAAAAAVGEEARELTVRAQQLYAAGESSITEMLDAFRAAEEARLALAERVLEIALARLQVMRATGTMFDVSVDRDCSLPQRRNQP
jgi:cobalt-zinc-cadmium efflux system outer membrane protein